MAEGIFAFMSEAGAHYARLDFLLAGDRYVFLEANFTGEWGWLDQDGKFGLRDKTLAGDRPPHPLRKLSAHRVAAVTNVSRARDGCAAAVRSPHCQSWRAGCSLDLCSPATL